MHFTLGKKHKNLIILKSLIKLSFNKSIVIMLVAIFLFLNKANSALPPLPTELPNSENTKSSNTQSFFDKIFKPKKSDSPAVQPKKQSVQEPTADSNIEEGEPLIDLGDKKLPILDNENILEKRKVINQVPKPLPDLNSVKDTQNIDDVIPSLPPDSQYKLKPPPSPHTSPVLPSVPADSTTNALPEEKALKILSPILSQPEENPLTTKVPKPQQVKEERGISREETAPSSPPLTSTPAPVIPKLLPEQPKEKIHIKTEEGKAASASPIPLLDKDIIPTKPQEQTPVPVFVKESQPIIEEDKSSKKKNTSGIVGEEMNKQEAIPKTPIKEATSARINTVLEKNNSEEDSKELALFIQDEIQMLHLPNDEIVLGVLTEEARIEQMEIRSFITMFRQIYDRQKQEANRNKVDNFIDHYNLTQPPALNRILLDNAFEAIRQNNLIALKTILDYYPILQKQDRYDYTLLHEAAKLNNYYVAKFLLIRGININILDNQCRTALEVAAQYNSIVACLIKQALGVN